MSFTYRSHISLTWVPIIVCTFVLILRLFVRIKLRNPGIEDWLVGASWICLVIAGTFVQDSQYLRNFQKPLLLHRYNAENCVQSIALAVSLVLGKASIAQLLLQIIGFTSRWRQWVIYTSMVVLGITTIFVIVVTVIPTCEDPKSTWLIDTCIQDYNLAVGLAECWNFYSAFFDVLYSILPLSFLYKMQMSVEKRVGLSLSLSLGWTAAGFSILRTICAYLWPDDMVKIGFYTAIASAVEPALIIICGTLASLTPVVRYVKDGTPLTPRGAASIPKANLLEKSKHAARDAERESGSVSRNGYTTQTYKAEIVAEAV